MRGKIVFSIWERGGERERDYFYIYKIFTKTGKNKMISLVQKKIIISFHYLPIIFYLKFVYFYHSPINVYFIV